MTTICKRIAVLPLLAMLSLGATSHAADYKVEKLEKAPPSELAPAIAEQLQQTGTRIIRGSSRTVANIWLTKQWDVGSFDTSLDIIYPFKPGQLVGVIQFERSASDFREQEIPEGVYTLRYAQQPVDGAHVGTSPTRDFLLLLPAEDDTSAEAVEYTPLTEQSAQVVGTAHPALLSLQRTIGEVEQVPGIRQDEQHDWWIVRLEGEAKAGDETKPMPIDLVIVGQAEAV